MCSILNLAARAFLQLGRGDDAAETARIAVSAEQQTMQKYVLVECHGVLGQVVAAKHGQLEEANGHFGRALEEADNSRRQQEQGNYRGLGCCLPLRFRRKRGRWIPVHGTPSCDASGQPAALPPPPPS